MDLRPRGPAGLTPGRHPPPQRSDSNRSRGPGRCAAITHASAYGAEWISDVVAIEHHASNGLIESVNTVIRPITGSAFGFRTPDALIALSMLSLGGHRPAVPVRE